MIAPNIRLLFDGSNASIPNKFVRDTAYDGRFLKGWGDESIGATGGADTHTHTFSHSHTIVNHTHTFSTNGGYNDGSGYNDAPNENSGWGIWDNHSHSSGNTLDTRGGTLSGTFTSGSATNNPPYYDFILIKSENYNLIPPNACVLRNDDSRTELTYHTASENRHIKIADSGGDAGNTGGSSSHSHSVNHDHGNVSHYHLARTNTMTGSEGGTGSTDNQQSTKEGHWHDFYSTSVTDNPNSYSGTSASANYEPPHKTLRVYKNSTGKDVLPQPGDIVMITTEAIPVGWVECNGTNGTPDLRNYFVKNKNASSTTGGSLGHSHGAGATHSHTATSSHTHGSVSTGGDDSGDGFLDGAGSKHIAPKGHHHTASNWSSATTSWNSASISLDTNSNTQPKYKIIKYVQMKFMAQSGGAFMAMKG